MDTGKSRRIVYGLIPIGIIGVIFAFSSQGGVNSFLFSNKVVDFLRAKKIEFLIPKLTELGIGSDIRKCAHIFLYFCLGVAINLMVAKYCTGGRKHRILISAMISMGICLILAGFDEWHQTFVPGREGKVSDIMFDAMGFVPGVIFLSGMSALRNKNFSH